MIDQKLGPLASWRQWPELILAWGMIYEYQPTMMHAKLMIVDNIFVSVGSGNFHNRSIRLNDEANLDVLDGSFAAQQTRLFEIDISRSREVTPANLRGLQFANPFQQAAGLVAPQL